MLSENRKDDLVDQLEYAVNKYLDKKWVMAELAESISENEAEKEFLLQLNGYFEIQYTGV